MVYVGSKKQVLLQSSREASNTLLLDRATTARVVATSTAAQRARHAPSTRPSTGWRMLGWRGWQQQNGGSWVRIAPS